MSAESPAESSWTATPFHDLTEFVAIPRVTALRLAPDGGWLAVAVQTLSADGKKYLTSLWRVDPGGGPPRRLTRSAEGEANPRFLPDGSLLFTSRRPDPGTRPGQQGRRRCRRPVALPPGGGEAKVIAALPGGVTAAEAARDAGTVVLGSPVMPAAGQGGTGGREVLPRGVRDGSPRGEEASPRGGGPEITLPRTTPGCARSAATPG